MLAPAREDPALLEPLAAGAPEVAAQVRWAREQEWALTADDVLARRTTLAALGRAARRARARGGAAAMSARFVAALDQGTTSSRCLLFDQRGRAVAARAARAPPDHAAPGLGRARRRRDPGALARLHRRGARRRRRAAGRRRRDRHRQPARDGRAVGARERAAARATRSSGRTRAAPSASPALGALDRFRAQTGLPLATYFSGPKLSWLLDALPGARARAEAGELAAGTIDSWLAWHLAGVHVTDATNASRTLLMDLRTLAWDDGLLDAIGVPRALLPEIGPSSGVVGRDSAACPLAGVLGDQQAALFGQCCFAPGEAKCTYGTGSFLAAQHRRARRAVEPRADHRRRLPPRRRRRPPTCSRARSPSPGALVQWLRDNLGADRARRPTSRRSPRACPTATAA